MIKEERMIKNHIVNIVDEETCLIWLESGDKMSDFSDK